VADPASSSSRQIFISYRREDSQHMAGRISDRLEDHFGEAAAFMDVDSIEPGADFAQVIDDAVGGCAVLLAVIGQGWVTAADQRGIRRLSSPDDFVGLEIGAALRRDVRVIPVLIDGATMPQPSELPPGLEALARKNAVRVDHESFHADMAKLLEALDRFLSDDRKPVPSAPSEVPSAYAPPFEPVRAPASPAPPLWLAFRKASRTRMAAGELRLEPTEVTWMPVQLTGPSALFYAADAPALWIPYENIDTVEFSGQLALTLRCRDGTTHEMEVAPVGAGMFRMPNSAKRKQARDEVVQAIRERLRPQ
jgi:hypothetical protein